MDDELYLRLLEAEYKFFKYLDDLLVFGIMLFIAGVICVALEKIRPINKDTPFFKKEFKKEIGLVALNTLMFIPLFAALISITLLTVLGKIAPNQMFDQTLSALPLSVQIIFALLCMDLSTYWRHRFTHNYMWPYHSFHHSAEEITWLTALRLHPVDYLTAMLFDTLVTYFLGFSGSGIVAANIIMMAYNYFTHLNLNVVFGKPMRYVFASPHFHRWHHATDKSAYDKNFCGMFSLLDVIFGTYYHPEILPTAYGLTPRDQKEVPEKLIPHILQPIKKDFRKLIRKKN